MADMPPITENPVILNLMSTYGPILIGALLSCVLYGMSCIQMFFYFMNCERDSVLMKLYVVLVWVVETVGTTLILVSLWPVMILNWGSLEVLSLTSFTILNRVWVAGLGTFLVHAFYIRRIYQLSGSLVLPLLLIPFTLYQLAETIAYVVLAYKSTELSSISAKAILDLGITGRAMIAFVDIMIVIAMIYSLVRDGVPQFTRSRKMVFRIIVMTVHTGLWTAILAIIDLGLIVPFPDQLYFCAVDFPLTSLYLNALLANLNAREFIRNTPVDDDYNTYALESGGTGPFGGFRPNRGIATNSGQSRGPNIRIHTDTAVDVDNDNEAILVIKS